MKKPAKDKIEQLLRNENGIDEISDFFSENIDENALITQVLKQSEDDEPTFGDKLSDKVAEFGGSWYFIIFFMSLLVVWIIVNSYVLLKHPFDPYPFILLNLILSCVAALQAPVIMMSQNRKEDKDRQRAEHDYIINLKAELEIRSLQLNMRRLFDIQKKQTAMLEEISKKCEK
jgi:uncharacterized membrane protein